MGIGVDIVKISRIEKSIKNATFLNRVFTKTEREYALKKKNPAATFAGIFAAKEAVIKAAGQKFSNLTIFKIGVEYNASAPFCILEGNYISLSIAHDGDYAIATAFFSP